MLPVPPLPIPSSEGIFFASLKGRLDEFSYAGGLRDAEAGSGGGLSCEALGPVGRFVLHGLLIHGDVSLPYRARQSGSRSPPFDRETRRRGRFSLVHQAWLRLTNFNASAPPGALQSNSGIRPTGSREGASLFSRAVPAGTGPRVRPVFTEEK